MPYSAYSQAYPFCERLVDVDVRKVYRDACLFIRKVNCYMPLQFSPRRGNASRPRIFYLWMVVPLLAIVLFTGTWTLFTKSFAHAAPVDTLVPFTGTIPTEIAHSTLIGPADAQASISLSIGLRLRNTAMLDSYLKDIARPKSLNYHRYLTPAQFAGTFSPSVATHDAMLKYLQSSGFTITHTYKHRLLIVFKGTIGLVEQVFHVTINNYNAPKGHTFYANSGDPQLPSSLAGQVQSISGLSNAVQFHHAALTTRTLGQQSNVTPNTASCPTSGSGHYLPSQIQAAYNLNGLYNKSIHGEGQTVALFELDGFQPSDIAAYEACFGHSHTSIQTIRINGGPSIGSGLLEVELDAEVVLSTAPKLGTLVVYEAPNTVTDYNAQWSQMLQDVPPVISSSWGLCESDFGTQQANQENTYFMQAAAQGQSIFVASGDSGSSGCYFDGNQSTNLEPGDPGGQPYVTSVGGTSMTWNGSTLGETTWNAGSGQSGGASGGGLSLDFAMPAWQSGFLTSPLVPGLQNSYTNGQREAPDVSFNADPATGYPVYCSSMAASCDPNNPWITVGGTSAASPMWAAMMALVNEESVKTGGFNIGFANPLLYQIASNSGKYASDFHDVTTGNNDYSSLQSGSKYLATAGFDMATGLGSFNADSLATDLVALANTNNGQRLAPASSTWYFPEGDEGGGFQEYITIENPDPTLTSTVQLTYVTATTTTVVSHTVAPSSRQTFDADIDMGTTPTGIRYNAGVIAHVTSGPAVVVERPIYFNWGGVPSGTDIVGATSTATAYYFAEADTTQSGPTNYKTFVALLNPGGSAAHLTVTYFTGSCTTSCPTESVTLGAMQRLVVSPTDVGLHQKLAISVTSSDNPFVAERPMYFADTIPRAGGLTTGAASVIGATTPDDDWLFAEGYTGSGFQEYFEMANFGSTPAVTNVRLEYTDGSTQTYTITVPAYGFYTFDVNAHQHTHTPSVSAEISTTGSIPIVVQRLMYFHYGNTHISGGTDIVGELGPASHNVYAFAEGYTGGAFQEYLTLQNPTNNNENVAITFFTPTVVFQIQATVLAHSRKTFSINNLLNPISQGAISLTIQALPTTGAPNPVIVAERPMYFFYRLTGISTLAAGGSDVIGFTG